MNKHGKKIALAPTGAGKTTYAETDPDVVDGDKFAYRGLKLGPKWWEGPSAAAIHAAAQHAVLNYDGPGDVIVWSTSVAAGGEMEAAVDAVAVPSVDELVRNHAGRRGALGPSADLDSKGHPILGRAALEGIAARYRELASRRGLQVHPSVQAAVQALRGDPAAGAPDPDVAEGDAQQEER